MRTVEAAAPSTASRSPPPLRRRGTGADIAKTLHWHEARELAEAIARLPSFLSHP